MQLIRWNYRRTRRGSANRHQTPGQARPAGCPLRLPSERTQWDTAHEFIRRSRSVQGRATRTPWTRGRLGPVALERIATGKLNNLSGFWACTLDCQIPCRQWLVTRIINVILNIIIISGGLGQVLSLCHFHKEFIRNFRKRKLFQSCGSSRPNFKWFSAR